MASVNMNGRNGKGCKCDINKALYGIPAHNYRTRKNHSNKDIDPTRSHLNRHYGPQTVQEFRERLRAMIAECDAKHPPRRVKKDRKVMIDMDIPSPREGMSAEDEARWSEATAEVIYEMFGDEVVGGTYHADEIHEYTDPHDKQRHKSRGHTHWDILPWTDQYGLNMDKFYKRDLPNKINAALDKKCRELFGYAYRDGSQTKSRGDVEQMKLESTIAEREQVEGQVAEYDQIIEMQERTIQQQDKQIETTQQALQEAQEEAERLKTENNTLMGRNEALRTRNNALERKADAAEERLDKAQGAFARLMDAVAAWVDAHAGLQRILRTAWRLQEAHRDKIESRMEATTKRGAKAITRASESIEDLLKAEQEVEKGTRIFRSLKTAVKEDLDPDELLDGMEL